MLALALALLASACSAPLPRDTVPADWRAHHERLQSLRDWTARGKLSLRSGEAAESAALEWRQRGDETRLRLSGPLGVGATEIYSDGRELHIRRGEERRVVDISTRGAVLLNTGWDLPLAALPLWLRGLPSPESRVSELERDPDTGFLRHFSQQGWDVHYERYDTFGAYTLPTRLRIEGADTRATVLIREWRAGAEP